MHELGHHDQGALLARHVLDILQIDNAHLTDAQRLSARNEFFNRTGVTIADRFLDEIAVRRNGHQLNQHERARAERLAEALKEMTVKFKDEAERRQASESLSRHIERLGQGVPVELVLGGDLQDSRRMQQLFGTNEAPPLIQDLYARRQGTSGAEFNDLTAQLRTELVAALLSRTIAISSGAHSAYRNRFHEVETHSIGRRAGYLAELHSQEYSEARSTASGEPHVPRRLADEPTITSPVESRRMEAPLRGEQSLPASTVPGTVPVGTTSSNPGRPLPSSEHGSFAGRMWNRMRDVLGIREAPPRDPRLGERYLEQRMQVLHEFPERPREERSAEIQKLSEIFSNGTPKESIDRYRAIKNEYGGAQGLTAAQLGERGLRLETLPRDKQGKLDRSAIEKMTLTERERTILTFQVGDLEVSIPKELHERHEQLRHLRAELAQLEQEVEQTRFELIRQVDSRAERKVIDDIGRRMAEQQDAYARINAEQASLQHIVLPEEIISLLRDTPDFHMVRRLMLENGQSPSNPFRTLDFYGERNILDRRFITAADASIERRAITIYPNSTLAELRRIMQHEWSHILENTQLRLRYVFEAATKLESSHPNISELFFHSDYGAYNSHEDWATTIGDRFLNGDRNSFYEMIQKASEGPSKAKVLIAIQAVLNAAEAAQARGVTVHNLDIMRNRMEYARHHLLEPARQELESRIRTAQTKEEAAAAAAVLTTLIKPVEIDQVFAIARSLSTPELAKAVMSEAMEAIGHSGQRDSAAHLLDLARQYAHAQDYDLARSALRALETTGLSLQAPAHQAHLQNLFELASRHESIRLDALRAAHHFGATVEATNQLVRLASSPSTNEQLGRSILETLEKMHGMGNIPVDALIAITSSQSAVSHRALELLVYHHDAKAFDYIRTNIEQIARNSFEGKMHWDDFYSVLLEHTSSLDRSRITANTTLPLTNEIIRRSINEIEPLQSLRENRTNPEALTRDSFLQFIASEFSGLGNHDVANAANAMLAGSISATTSDTPGSAQSANAQSDPHNFANPDNTQSSAFSRDSTSPNFQAGPRTASAASHNSSRPPAELVRLFGTEELASAFSARLALARAEHQLRVASERLAQVERQISSIQTNLEQGSLNETIERLSEHELPILMAAAENLRAQLKEYGALEQQRRAELAHQLPGGDAQRALAEHARSGAPVDEATRRSIEQQAQSERQRAERALQEINELYKPVLELEMRLAELEARQSNPQATERLKAEIERARARFAEHPDLALQRIAFTDASGSFPPGVHRLDVEFGVSGRRGLELIVEGGKAVSARLVENIVQQARNLGLEPAALRFANDQRLGHLGAHWGTGAFKPGLLEIVDGNGARHHFIYLHEAGHLFDLSMMRLSSDKQVSKLYEQALKTHQNYLKQLLRMSDAQVTEVINKLKANSHVPPTENRQLYPLSLNEVIAELFKYSQLRAEAVARGERPPSFSYLIRQFGADRTDYLHPFKELFEHLDLTVFRPRIRAQNLLSTNHAEYARLVSSR